MIRKAFVMQLRPTAQTEYINRHNPIWPELQATLKAHGVAHYSIFLDRASDRLFGYVVVASEEQWRRIATTEVCRRWWSHMKELMLTNLDDSPITTELDEVFYLE